MAYVKWKFGMTKKPGKAVRLRRTSQKVVISLALSVFVLGAASAQWGGWWGGSSSNGGWWASQRPYGRSNRTLRRQRREAQQYAPQQTYQPQQQYYPFYRSTPPQQSAQQRRDSTRRIPPVMAYAPPDARETRRSRLSSPRGSIRVRPRRGDGAGRFDKSDNRTRSYEGITYCVRLCDGRYYQLSDPGRMKSEELCSALCPASDTKVFTGSNINEAAASDGSRYEKLKNAFLYRKQLVANCTCNGKNVFGLARIDIKSDPTLQTGDIVVMTEGLSVYSQRWKRRGSRGRQGRRYKATPHFTPIRRSSLVSRSFRRTLSRIEIAKTRSRAGSQQQAKKAEPDQPDLTD
jgi:hypothetical protein